jgi:MFS family permease
MAPALQSTFKLSLGQVGLLLAAVNAGITVALIPWGIFVDRFGERAGVTIGLAGAVIGVLFAASASRFELLWLALLGTGMCTAAVLPATGASLMHWFPPTHRGLAIGIRHAGTPLGALLAALVLPAIADTVGLRWAFVSLAIPCVLSISLAAAVFGTSEPYRAVAGSRFGALSDGRIWRLAWSGSALFMTQSAILGFVVVFLHQQRGMTAASAAAVLGVTQVGGAILRIAAGRWSDRRSARVRPLRQFALLTCGSLAVVAVTTQAPLAVVVVALIIAGSLSMGSGALLFTATVETAQSGRTGSALGLQQTILGFAATGSPIAFAATVSHTSWAMAFAAAAIFPLVAVALLQGSLRNL